MSVDGSADILFKAQFKDVSKRFEMEGLPVPANAEVVIVHNRTGKNLCTDKIQYHNDFGTEYEVCCDTLTNANRSYTLTHEKSGKVTSDNNAKEPLSQNFWAFLTASNPAMETAQKVDSDAR